jgi:hypothetical protein
MKGIISKLAALEISWHAHLYKIIPISQSEFIVGQMKNFLRIRESEETLRLFVSQKV